VTGLAPTVALRRGETVGHYLDWADLTFKTSGWTTKKLPLTEVGGGFYAVLVGLNLSTITNLPITTTLLAAEYEVTGAVEAIALDVITLQDDTARISELLACSKNRLEIDFTAQELVLYADDGTTVAQRWPLESNGGEDVATQFGVQTKRKAPLL